jgi:hypothetical protein
MSFLDNAGTIQIDAVLTELGRKRLSQGNFRVTKFMLGDDEVDYGLFDASKEIISTGSMPGDGENVQNTILSQSCLEAFSNQSAVINYGLTTFNRDDIFFLPILKINNKIQTAAVPTGSFYYFSVNDETTNKLKNVFKNDKYVLENLATNKTKLIIESGLSGSDTSAVTDLERTKEYRKAYLVDTGLLDLNYAIYCDSRFIEKVYTPSPGSVFRNKDVGATMDLNFGAMEEKPPTSLKQIVDKFNCYIGRAAINDVVDKTYSLGSDNDLSSLNGPRGTALAINFGVENTLTKDSTKVAEEKYFIFGATGQTLFDGVDKYDYIDTTIYVEGLSSTATVQIPLRIVRYAGT